MSNFRDAVVDFFEMLFDKRLSWRFKIANWILGDDLRLNLAIARSNIISAAEYVDKSPKFATMRMHRAVRCIDELWRYPD